jgi:tellurite resistance-related uncharacterized protein
MPTPYRSTPLFDEATLPPALRNEHSAKRGVGGVIRVIEGKVKLSYVNPANEVIITAANPGLILPEQRHFVEPLGPITMQVDFYDEPPSGYPPFSTALAFRTKEKFHVAASQRPDSRARKSHRARAQHPWAGDCARNV